MSSRVIENAPDAMRPQSATAAGPEREVLSESAFRRMMAVERKRTERSRHPFLLVLIEACENIETAKAAKLIDAALAALLPETRETDGIGWYEGREKLGIIYTGLSESDKASARATILGRISVALQNGMPGEWLSQIAITFHFYPDDWDDESSDGAGKLAVYPDVVESNKRRRLLLTVKRMIDVAGSLALLTIFAPLFLLIAAAVKLSSPGPIFFKQARVGQYGRRFTFLKFRSMRVNNDASAHKEYVTKLIAGNAERVSVEGSKEGVYKLAGDRRITPVGGFLRRTSLDELPQFINVLLGDMSLVGPRPPIPYELAAYKTWHRNRLLQVKPGITGLWQVTGRSRVTFDEMVRLDLRYATSWSPLLDLKILLMTPAAVIKGAY